jgi:hypothetical protein
MIAKVRRRAISSVRAAIPVYMLRRTTIASARTSPNA